MDYSILDIKGIGEKKGKLFRKLGIYTVRDLVEYYPRDYKDRTEITNVASLKKGDKATLLCRIRQRPENIRIKSLMLTKVKIEDDTGSIDCAWFNMPYLKAQFKEGDYYYFVGTAGERLGRLTLTNPEFEKAESAEPDAEKETESLSHGRIVPVYKSTAGLTQKAIRQAIDLALKKTDLDAPDCIPPGIIEKNGLCKKKYAITNIHFPETNEAFLKSRKRLCFDELFILQTALFKFKSKRIKDIKGFQLQKCGMLEMPFELTRAQKNALRDIEADMKSGIAMNRLIQGDVGSGKTAVALIAAFRTIQNGFQCALMAPTEVLATQHFESVSGILAEHGINTVILKGSMTKSEKDKALSAIASGKAKMVVGTHAVIQKAVVFNKLGLVVTDEQHRFGVKQRGALQEKGESPHVIVMTATPIPRTLALILYGDLDISVIDELPPGRREIETYSVTEAYRERIYAFVRKQADEGRQIYIVCAAIQESENNYSDEMYFVNSHVEELQKNVFKGYSVSALHGKMKPQEKERIMEEFSKGEIKILVSTTVIEVGINVPNATVMVVENAERFGLSQLHQLRGRVGRGAHKSYCVLISNSEDGPASERLDIMKKTTDGFVVSEMDLKLRGSGDFFGTRQHGLPEMKIANMFKDIDILKMAQKSAETLIREDPLLELPENSLLSDAIESMFSSVKFGINL